MSLCIRRSRRKPYLRRGRGGRARDRGKRVRVATSAGAGGRWCEWSWPDTIPTPRDPSKPCYLRVAGWARRTTDRRAHARPERGTPPIDAAHPRHDWAFGDEPGTRESRRADACAPSPSGRRGERRIGADFPGLPLDSGALRHRSPRQRESRAPLAHMAPGCQIHSAEEIGVALGCSSR
jgi:hypothetical protein